MQKLKKKGSYFGKKIDLSFIVALSNYLGTKRSAWFRSKLSAQYHDFMNPTQLLRATLSLPVFPSTLTPLPH